MPAPQRIVNEKKAIRNYCAVKGKKEEEVTIDEVAGDGNGLGYWCFYGESTAASTALGAKIRRRLNMPENEKHKETFDDLTDTMKPRFVKEWGGYESFEFTTNVRIHKNK